ncbi:MAG: hypothetical protein FJ186_00885 [Gammaproteobacteria bacterium]|jgi:hypothetical protein|nr:hypothetical protein [Gammaproteobacteria bacterium]
MMTRPWLLILIILTGCQTHEPRHFEDACQFLYQNSDWYRYARDAELTWGVSSGLILSVIYQESSFKAKAAHEHKYFMGFIPWGRVSSAYGFAQAKDEVWHEYLAERGGFLTERSRFKDASDFVGWYLNRISKQLHLKKTDAYHLYLAYHEGPAGFKKKSFRFKPWLMAVAQKVSLRSVQYQKQLEQCQWKLKLKSLYLF